MFAFHKVQWTVDYILYTVNSLLYMVYREQLTKQSRRKAVAYVSTQSQEQEQVQIIRIRGDKKGAVILYSLNSTVYS